jgi:hypothetical protein
VGEGVIFQWRGDEVRVFFLKENRAAVRRAKLPQISNVTSDRTISRVINSSDRRLFHATSQKTTVPGRATLTSSDSLNRVAVD